MIRRVGLTCVVLLIGVQLLAQPYGNEWINYNKSYYRVALAEDGIYRLTFNDLQSAGFPVSTIDPRRLQLFYKGEEIAITVSGQGDAIFNTNDFIEFYGQRNDGQEDARLYRPAEAQPHQFYSLYSDSSSYFLTYNLDPTNGKRMTTFSENNTGQAALEFHEQEIRQLQTEQYSTGQGFSTQDITKFTYFDFAEGWTSRAINEGQSQDFTLTGVDNAATSNGVPRIEVLLTGRDNLPHNAEIFVGPSIGGLRSLGTIQFDNYESQLFTRDLNWSDISGSGSLTVRVVAQGVSGGNDRLSTSYIRLFYPQQFDMNAEVEKLFNLPVQTTNKAYIEIVNVPAQTRLFDVTDPANVVRIGSNDISNGISAVVNNTLANRSLVANGATFKTPDITKVSFRDINPNQPDYLIISHKRLMRPTSGSSNPVKDYAAYRASAQGGGYDTLVVDIDMLYNQFNYGIRSPLAIYDFMRFMVTDGDPRFLFIVGKGLGPELGFYRNPNGFFVTTSQGVSYEIRDLVPAAGTPGADILFSSGLGGTTYEPAVATGRLPARTPEHVEAYLNKVIEMEALPFDDLWRKDVLHLSGGITASELVIFRGYMEEFEAVAEDNFLGGEVATLSKTSGSTVELINVSDEVNEGVNLITFYGHSAPNVTDIDIGFVTDPLLGYNNRGRYPSFLVNGCNAGEFFTTTLTFGEDWILAAERGAIGFIAHSSFGFVGNLRRYTDTFYETGYGDSLFVSKTQGEIHQETARRYMSSSSETPNNITQAQQMVYLGDPAVNLFGAELPDYEINPDNISITSFDEEPVTALSDSFAINIPVRNFGRTRSDSIAIRVIRTLADNSQLTYDSLFPNVNYADTLIFSIKRENEDAFGNNRFDITVDSESNIPELSETNNTASVDFFISLFVTQNLLPDNFAIVNEPQVTLKVQATDVLEGQRDFLIELDTVSTFNSPFRQSTTISTRLLAEWQVDLLPNLDSTVYYWRSRFANLQSGESEEYATSSFTYINNGPEGWTQRKFEQFTSNALIDLVPNENLKQFDFLRTSRQVAIRTYGSLHPSDTIFDVSVQIDNAEFIINNESVCRENTLNLIAFRKEDAVPYAAVPLRFRDIRTCGRQPQVINSFRLNEIETAGEGLINYVDNVNAGDSVIIFSIGDPQIQSYPASVITKLEELGISTAEVTALLPGEPFMFFGRKGDSPGEAEVFKTSQSPVEEQELSNSFVFTGIKGSGSIVSNRIGPASAWGSLTLKTKGQSNDQFELEIIGVTSTGSETTLFSGVTNFPIDISGVNPTQYPFLKLVLSIADETELTAPQLQNWLVSYEPVAEGILLAPNETLETTNVQEGEVITKAFGFINISEKNFSDSLSVEQVLFNQTSRTTARTSFFIQAPTPGDTTLFNREVSTIGRAGANDISITINSTRLPELNFDNNSATISEAFIVAEDNTNPLLDVLFDGRYIINGDIVSPSPVISIRLKDENPFLKVNDTTSVNVFIKQDCDGCTFNRVAYESNQINWFAATEDTDFRIEYTPDKFEDGIYTLRVDAADRTGNASGSEPYLISFEVVNESTVTNFYPYPNPFSTRTRFVFTLTGSSIPEDIIIQIMTVTGKVVREITQDELGPIHIGNNITDYFWDGRDEFGDRLANGVYLYKVFVKNNGEHLKQRSTSADKAFKNGFGKLYILR